MRICGVVITCSNLTDVPPSGKLINLDLVNGIIVVLPGPGIASDDLREVRIGNALKQVVQVEVEAIVHIWPGVKEPC